GYSLEPQETPDIGDSTDNSSTYITGTADDNDNATDSYDPEPAPETADITADTCTACDELILLNNTLIKNTGALMQQTEALKNKLVVSQQALADAQDELTTVTAELQETEKACGGGTFNGISLRQGNTVFLQKNERYSLRMDLDNMPAGEGGALYLRQGGGEWNRVTSNFAIYLDTHEFTATGSELVLAISPLWKFSPLEAIRSTDTMMARVGFYDEDKDEHPESVIVAFEDWDSRAGAIDRNDVRVIIEKVLTSD
ncbi:MAG: hypothetical protein GY868_12435, partial [Deltaproteobacteria bacterium]|nr:hypothetical protein [Deltaproteobacteria bacterium]